PDGTLVRRVLPLEEFLVGPGRTRRRPDELLATVRVPAAAPDAIWRFFKSGTRPALDISAVSIGLLARKAGNALHEVRIALGAVAPTVVRARAAEATLEGRVLNPETMEAAACAARDEVHPISDVRASAWYRKELIHNMLRRMLSDVAET
ncbi:MAG: xanthine dehydrogenase family protein subunit M, partial [Rhodocyclales bacterium CG17_big_fil_post_rev_8_21_14_2_50_68_7]